MDSKEDTQPSAASGSVAGVEAPLLAALDNIMSQEDVTGAATADENGLCIGARGTLNAGAIAFLHGILESATKLTGAVGEGMDAPVVTIETDASQLVVSGSGGTLGIARTRLPSAGTADGAAEAEAEAS